MKKLLQRFASVVKGLSVDLIALSSKDASCR